MAAPKKPQDRKPKDEPKPRVEEMDAGWRVTHRGITVTVPREALDDFELLDDLAELQKDPKRGTPRVPSMLRRLAGTDGFRAVTDGLRDKETGRVPASTAVRFVFEVFQSLNSGG
ncbi:hypothetical protein [Microbacterium sp. KNMS]